MEQCCSPGQSRYDEAFDARFARQLDRRYRRKGLTGSERRIAERIESEGVEGTSVLEVGGGIGAIQLELLRHGASSTTNLEMSGAYESAARALLDEAGLSSRARRLVGVDLATADLDVSVADHVVLHRVVCCYPDAVALLAASAAHARRTVVFSHPARTWPRRALVGAANLMMRLRGKEYRGYLHRPDAMYDTLRSAGFALDDVIRAGPWRIAAAHRA
ncbi:SAM-dependent methyltransferase [Agromyces bracchium]|uniref:SAM-dependent methyltransferase n=1 Tax=Agromyces bracchium TaxID=88376 RepID=UPI0018ACF9CD|nr:SAM-dependent methyltransferase [Agromyces bracchium]